MSTPSEGKMVPFKSEAMAVHNSKVHQALKLEHDQLQMKLALMAIEMKDRRSEAQKTDESAIKSSLAGVWKIVQSINVAEYLEALQLHASFSNDLFHAIFQLANAHLEFNGDDVTLYHQVGNRKYYTKTVTLSQQHQFVNRTASASYICGNAMKTVYVTNSEDVTEEERRFLMYGRLYVVMKRNGVECTRIYEKLENGRISVDEANEEIEQVYSRMELLGLEILKEKNASESLQEQVKQLKQKLDLIPIHISIIGNWQNVQEPSDIISLTIESSGFVESSDRFAQKQCTSFDGRGGFYMSIEENRIVRRENFGLKRKVKEFFIESEQLFIVTFPNFKTEYRKIGPSV